MQAPTSFDELKQRIADRYDGLSGRLRQFAEYALASPRDVALEPVAAIAERAGVQPSSIVRFAHALGYAGFSEMQRVFRSHLVGRPPSYRDRIAHLRTARSNGRGDAPRGVLAGFISDGIDALEHLHDAVRPAELGRAVQALGRAEAIYLAAEGRAFPVAFYLYYALARLDRRAYLIDGVGGMDRAQAALAGARDALIAISFKDYSPGVVSLFEAARARRVTTVAITDTALGPLSRHAAVTLELGDDGNRPFRSLAAPMCLAQTLVVALGHHLEAKPRA